MEYTVNNNRKLELIGKIIKDINFNENNIEIKMEDGTVVRCEFDYDEWIGIRLELYINGKYINKGIYEKQKFRT